MADSGAGPLNGGRRAFSSGWTLVFRQTLRDGCRLNKT